uniref:DNA-directed DNA polymerase n=1 Tax=Motacilla densovirus TaxID=2794502 RepID=A0A8A4XCN2_9VIRU|nr:MAG: structural protein [Motacilla densovirus]
MARFLDVDSPPLFGYFYSTSFDDIIFYLRELISVYNESYLCTAHASAIFVHSNGEERELHMSALNPILFDPADPPMVFDDRVQNMFDDLTNPEAYENIEGSGWTIIPNTFTYWVNTIRYQPNNNPDPNNHNVVDHPTDDPDDPDNDHAYSSDVNHVLNDSFLLSLAAYHVPKSGHTSRLLYKRRCERWVTEKGLSPPPGSARLNLGTIAAWHESVYDYHIRIFSEHGNVIYHNYFPKNNPDKPIIDILHKNKKFSLITNLWTLLKEKRDRPFCSACKKFHSHNELCANTISAARSENISAPELPSNLHSLVFYCDFESFIKNNHHHPSGYAICMVLNGQLVKNVIIDYLHTPDVAEHFIKTIISLCNDYCKSNNPTHLCGICDFPIQGGSYVIARNYINGREGSHHSNCWEDMRNCAYVFFHNFRGYDSHYVLAQAIRHSDINALRGKSFEKFDLISCSSGPFARYSFKDTYNFLSNSLAQLVKNVVDWRFTPPEGRTSKGVFPYDWFDDPEKLEYRNLPPKEFWFNKLTQSELDFQYAQKIWEERQMTSFRDYHSYYMSLDTIQLADVFEEFRRAVYAEFNVDPVYCQGSPSLTWQLCLNKYAEKIKVITDVNVYIDIQRNIRGGIAQVMTRHVDVSKKGGDILYLDINSLYSSCMEEKMPTSYVAKLTELPPNWMEKFADPTSDYTALMCVDLHYPPHLHDNHRFYPLAPHKYNNRLCATFVDKENYLTHARNLKFYLDNGLVLIKFHYMYIFKQDSILKEYVSSNIEKRQIASRNENKVLIQLYKLLNNSLYGKTCENKFKYRKYAVRDPFEGIWGKKNPFMFKSRNWLEIDNKILCEQDNTSITLDKPIQIGFTVLEFAKLKMYSFVYDLFKYFPEAELIYTDTDSLMIWFPYKDPQKKIIDSPLCFKLDFEKTPDWFGVRTVNTDKVSGLWSLEADKKIKQFVGLRAKTYAIEFEDGSTTLKNKGIIRNAREEDKRKPLEMGDYLECLYTGKDVYVEQIMIRSKKHEISTHTQRKLALSSSDEKRVILADKITTLPFGYQGDMYMDDNVILPSDDNL